MISLNSEKDYDAIINELLIKWNKENDDIEQTKFFLNWLQKHVPEALYNILSINIKLNLLLIINEAQTYWVLIRYFKKSFKVESGGGQIIKQYKYRDFESFEQFYNAFYIAK